MSDIADRYRIRADKFESLVAGTRPDQWSNQSPCDEWDARAVVGHIIDMHDVVLSGLDTPADRPSLVEDPLGAFRFVRAQVESRLGDEEVASQPTSTPMGEMRWDQHVDGVPSTDMVLHGWDLARATEQDDTMDPDEVATILPGMETMPAEMRIPEAFGPGVIVFGPEFPVPADATPQQRLIGLMGRDPQFTP